MVGLMVMVPLFTPGQEVAVGMPVDVIPDPVPINGDLVPVQPLASTIVKLCVPGARLVNTLLVCAGPPSNE